MQAKTNELATFSYDDIQRHRKAYCSQIDEDGVIEYLFTQIGTKPLKMFVEIGVSPNVSSDNRRGKLEGNMVYLRNKGWVGWMIDGATQDEQFGISKATITPENVNVTLAEFGVPKDFDLFSIDIDSIEYYVIKEMLKEFSPRVVVSEYNCIYEDKRAVARSSDYKWKGDLFGVSGLLLKELMMQNNYTMVHTNRVNAFFVKNSELSDECKAHFANLTPEYFPLYPVTSKPSSWMIIP